MILLLNEPVLYHEKAHCIHAPGHTFPAARPFSENPGTPQRHCRRFSVPASAEKDAETEKLVTGS
jgi:hypothetical protein